MYVSYCLQSIKNIGVIDDKPDARETMSESIEDANFKPVLFNKQLRSLDLFIDELYQSTNAAIFDYHLKIGNFACFNGAEAVAKLYANKFPALLVTTYNKADIDEIRLYRRKIPVLIPGGTATPEMIITGLETCLKEFNNYFSESRKPYRTLIRIEDIDRERKIIFIIIPAWNPAQVVRIPSRLIPDNLLNNKKTTRFFANVNIGAENDEDLFFENFTIAEKPGEPYAKFLHT